MDETDTKTEAAPSANAVEMQSNLRPWVKGQSGNPKGKKPGTRNRVIEASIKALGEDFETHGVQALQSFRLRDPGGYCKMVFALHPKKIETKVETTIFQELNLRDPKEFSQAWEIARDVLHGRVPALIDVTPEPGNEAQTAWRSDGHD